MSEPHRRSTLQALASIFSLDEREFPLGLVLSMVACVASGFGGCYAGSSMQMTIERGVAAQASVGRYVTDEKTGDKTFVYGVKE